MASLNTGRRRKQSSREKEKAPRHFSFAWLITVSVAFLLGRHSTGNPVVRSAQVLVQPDSDNENDNDNPRRDDGWHSIDVFYGDTKHLDQTNPPPAFRGRPPKAIQDWYGQANQDKLVYELFNGKTNGYFVDLASNDARTFSNTFALERHHNWTGLCIEPNPQYWPHLAYRKCQVVAAVVGAKRMEEVHFRFHSGVNAVLGGIVGDKYDITTQKDKLANHQQPPTPKYTVPLLEILQRYRAPKNIDYLSLDVEGAEEDIMKVFPLHQYHINVMTIERPSPGLQQFLTQHRFKLIQNITRWGETLWAHQTFLKEQGKEIQ